MSSSSLPLANHRILITRTRQQASTLAAELESRGAIPILIPTIELAAPGSFAALDSAMAAIRSYDWLIFTSANAVDAFHRRAQFHRLTAIPRRIAVIGPATARAVESIGMSVDLIPPKYVAESLAEALTPHAPDSNMLLVRAEHARDILPQSLTAAGATLTIANAYRNQVPPESITQLKELFSTPDYYPDAITFTSASTATNLFSLLESAGITLPPDIALVSIGPITSAALRDLGHQPTIEAAEPTIPSFIQALVSHLILR